jgi:hypothetical protein
MATKTMELPAIPKSNELALIELPPTNSWIFAYTRWDTISVAAGIVKCILTIVVPPCGN